jgi:glycosyltransferase involved in cell wall biosynthesis
MHAKIQLPSFSIVLETENLASADIQGLVQAITALAAQDPPPTLANEVLLIDSGDTPADLLNRLCHQYPWITVLSTSAGTGYYQAKMFGAAKATGEIIVYYDSDCLYQPHWLRTILTTFAQSNEIQIVAGETTTRGSGPYGTAMALTYIFPQFSGQTTLKPTTQYFLNNVAFRREFLLQHPIPTDLPLYRGHCVIHAHALLQKGYTIWQQPQAQTTHAPPNGLSHFFWRFLLIGHDYYWQKRLLAKAGVKPKTSTDPTLIGWRGKFQVLDDRLGKMIRAQPMRLVWFPIALPIVFAAVTLIFIGYWITAIQPNFLLTTYNQLLGEE